MSCYRALFLTSLEETTSLSFYYHYIHMYIYIYIYMYIYKNKWLWDNGFMFFCLLFCFVLFFVFFAFAFLFHLLFSLSVTLIIGIFYCLNYTSLLVHLVTTHLVSHLSLSSIVFIISTLINYRHLSLSWLHLAITSSLYKTPCNRVYNNYVINIYPRQLLWTI